MANPSWHGQLLAEAAAGAAEVAKVAEAVAAGQHILSLLLDAGPVRLHPEMFVDA